MNDNNYGSLINKDITIHRKYFKEMCNLLGIYVLYRAPKENLKTYDIYGDLDAQYYDPIKIGCIFDEHPTQQTLKKLGWVSELQEESSIIHVPLDLINLQQGALFIIPSALNPNDGRVFRVIKMSTIMIYPASIACEIAPEYENTFDADLFDHTHNDFNLLNKG